jgi:membrane protein
LVHEQRNRDESNREPTRSPEQEASAPPDPDVAPQREENVGAEIRRRVSEHDLTGHAAEIAFRFLFAAFPFGLFVASLAAFVAAYLHIEDAGPRMLAALGDNLPPPLASSVGAELQHVMQTVRPEMLSFGALAALWAATGGTIAVIKGMNRAYEVPESRPFVLRYLIAAGLTLLGSIGVIGSFVTIVGGTFLTQKVASEIGLGEQASVVLGLLRWPAVFLVLTVAVSILYRFGPNLVAPWRMILLGAAAFALGWLIATVLLSFYVTQVTDYGVTYGSLAGVVILMLWFYLTALLLVAGAEIVVEATRRWAPGALQERRQQIEASEKIRDATSKAGDAVKDVGSGLKDEERPAAERRQTPERRQRSMEPHLGAPEPQLATREPQQIRPPRRAPR